MKFSAFKEAAAKRAASPNRFWLQPVTDPARLIADRALGSDGPIIPEVLNDDEEVLIVQLKQGWCPICHYRVHAFSNPQHLGLMHYKCEATMTHEWAVDYVRNKIEES